MLRKYHKNFGNPLAMQPLRPMTMSKKRLRKHRKNFMNVALIENIILILNDKILGLSLRKDIEI